MYLHQQKVPDWDQHFNVKTTFWPGMIGLVHAFNEEYENEQFNKQGTLNDVAVLWYLQEMGI